MPTSAGRARRGAQRQSRSSRQWSTRDTMMATRFGVAVSVTENSMPKVRATSDPNAARSPSSRPERQRELGALEVRAALARRRVLVEREDARPGRGEERGDRGDDALAIRAAHEQPADGVHARQGSQGRGCQPAPAGPAAAPARRCAAGRSRWRAHGRSARARRPRRRSSPPPRRRPAGRPGRDRRARRPTSRSGPRPRGTGPASVRPRRGPRGRGGRGRGARRSRRRPLSPLSGPDPAGRRRTRMPRPAPVHTSGGDDRIGEPGVSRARGTDLPRTVKGPVGGGTPTGQASITGGMIDDPEASSARACRVKVLGRPSVVRMPHRACPRHATMTGRRGGGADEASDCRTARAPGTTTCGSPSRPPPPEEYLVLVEQGPPHARPTASTAAPSRASTSSPCTASPSRDPDGTPVYGFAGERHSRGY